MTPSNANTSGLEAWAYRLKGHEEWSVTTSPSTIAAVEDRPNLCDVEPLVTAASAQARIAELVGRNDLLAGSNDLLAGLAASATDRATAAEARADRLAASLIEALPYVESCEYDNGYKPGAVLRVMKNIRAALQQEG